MNHSRQSNRRGKRSRFGSISRTKSGKYRARYTATDGRRPTKDFPTHELARAWLSQLEVQKAKGEILGDDVEPIAFTEFTTIYRAIISDRQSKTTVDATSGRIRQLEAAFGRVSVHQIRVADVSRFKNDLYARGLAHASVNRYLWLISAIIEEAIQMGYAKTNPCRQVPRAKETKRAFPYLDLAEQREIVEHCTEIRPALGFCAELTLETGLRVGELIRLRARDVDRRTNDLSILETKTGEPRLVPLTIRAQQAIDGLLGADPHPEAFVCPWRTSRGGIRRFWCAARTAAGHPDLRWHDMRHLAACNMLAAGVGLPIIARILGNTMQMCAQRYADHAPTNYRIQARSMLERQREDFNRAAQGA